MSSTRTGWPPARATRSSSCRAPPADPGASPARSSVRWSTAGLSRSCGGWPQLHQRSIPAGCEYDGTTGAERASQPRLERVPRRRARDASCAGEPQSHIQPPQDTNPSGDHPRNLASEPCFTGRPGVSHSEDRKSPTTAAAARSRRALRPPPPNTKSNERSAWLRICPTSRDAQGVRGSSPLGPTP
jgi:hypothetical protein